MNTQKSLEELISKIEQALAERGQSPNTISQYHYIYQVFLSYSMSFHNETFSSDILNRCLREHYGINMPEATLSRKQHYKKQVLRAYHMLCDYANGNELANRYLDRASILTTTFYKDIVSVFCKSRLADGFSPKSVQQYGMYIEQFLALTEKKGIFYPSEITANTIDEFMLTLLGFSKSTVKYVTISLRVFFKYLYINKYTSMDLSVLVTKINVRSQTQIPSVWEKDNVLKLLNAIDRGNPSGKRDYAIILLVARLGIRVSDVNNLKFENINWQKNSIEFIQCKTGQFVRLPLLKDVGWSIIDYMQNGRPKIESPFVFLTHIPPFKGYSSDNHLYATLQKYISLAGIQGISRQRCGMHSLRHSLANRLLENHESLHTISSALGHTSLDSASVYLKADIERLRECSLSISEVGI